MPDRDRKNHISILLLCIVGTLLSCGKPEVSALLDADYDRTYSDATGSDFKYCNIRDGAMCISESGVLRVEMPIELSIMRSDPSLQDEILLANESDEPLAIDEFKIAVLDDENRIYYADFDTKSGYTGGSGEEPAEVIPGHRSVKVRFWVTLEDVTNTIQSVTLHYRLRGHPNYSKIVVSYRVSSYFELL